MQGTAFHSHSSFTVRTTRWILLVQVTPNSIPFNSLFSSLTCGISDHSRYVSCHVLLSALKDDLASLTRTNLVDCSTHRMAHRDSDHAASLSRRQGAVRQGLCLFVCRVYSNSILYHRKTLDTMIPLIGDIQVTMTIEGQTLRVCQLIG